MFHPAPAAPVSAGFRLSGAPILLFFALLLGAGFFGYRHWISTPQYSLLQARNAFVARDLPVFEKYVALDLCADALVEDAVSHALEEARRQTPASQNRFEELGRQLAEGFLQMLKPMASKIIVQTVRGAFQTPEKPAPEAPETEKIVRRAQTKIEEQNIEYGGLGDVIIEDENATVVLLFQSRTSGKTHNFTLKMRRVENYWQVVQWCQPTRFLEEIGADFNLAPTPKPTLTPQPATE